MRLKTKNKKIISFIVAGIIALVLAVTAGSLYLKYGNGSDTARTTPLEEINYNPPVKEQRDAGSQAKESAIDTPVPNSDASKQSKTVGVIITQAEQENDGSLRVGAIVQTTDIGGRCTLRLVHPQRGTVVTKESPTISQSRYLACVDFSISPSDLSSGDWQLTIEYLANNEHGSAAQSVRIK